MDYFEEKNNVERNLHYEHDIWVVIRCWSIRGVTHFTDEIMPQQQSLCVETYCVCERCFEECVKA